jgi:RHS repeat-associated protein
VGGAGYAYDANGNMVTRGGQTITWDAENRPVSVSENGETVLYINKYFEVNLSTSTSTSYYYLGDRLIAMSENSTLKYVHQDHLAGTSLMTDSSGGSLGVIKFYPYGEARFGSVPTDKKFTGQRLDSTGLYYYGARYYDPAIGRFISADTVVPSPTNPQNLNRYSYALNNPLKYTDPTRHDQIIVTGGVNSNGETWYIIYNGAGNLLAIATGLNDLANRMSACESRSRGVDLASNW